MVLHQLFSCPDQSINQSIDGGGGKGGGGRGKKTRERELCVRVRARLRVKVWPEEGVLVARTQDR
eukprot:COSAG01_NODE_5667_length_4111_cov_6.282154_2_plen_65_part_00